MIELVKDDPECQRLIAQVKHEHAEVERGKKPFDLVKRMKQLEDRVLELKGLI